MEEELEVEMVVYNYLRVKVRHSSYAPLSSKVSIRAVRCIWEKGEALRVSTGGGGLRERSRCCWTLHNMEGHGNSS